MTPRSAVVSKASETSAADPAPGSRWSTALVRLLRTTAGEVALLLLSAVLFALAHPSLATEWGLGPVAFVAVAPVFLVLRRAGWVQVVLYGALYGYVSYALYNYWLATFHPLAIIIVPVVYMGYLVVLFPLLKLADHLFPALRLPGRRCCSGSGYELVEEPRAFWATATARMGYTQYLMGGFHPDCRRGRRVGSVAAGGGRLRRWLARLLAARPGRARGSLGRRRTLTALLAPSSAYPPLCWAVLMAANVGVRRGRAQRLPAATAVARGAGAAEHRSLARRVLRLREVARCPVAPQRRGIAGEIPTS